VTEREGEVVNESHPRVRRPTDPKRAPAAAAGASTKRAIGRETHQVLSQLERHGSRRNRKGMARYGIHTARAFGVPMGVLQRVAKRLGKSHDLAGALWETGWYEARIVATFVDDPSLVTPAQMDRWCRDFDNWAICDTACFHLFDRTAHAFRKVSQWSRRRGEFQKRAAFALLASLALHDKRAADEPFTRCLPLIERAARDERNFVKKGVSWALRAIGRRNPQLHSAAVAVARRLSTSRLAAERWVGNDAQRELTSPAVIRRLDAQRDGPKSASRSSLSR
jgi:3-methyladenine DNA glycosylase AlkD